MLQNAMTSSMGANKVIENKVDLKDTIRNLLALHYDFLLWRIKKSFIMQINSPVVAKVYIYCLTFLF